MSFDSSSLTFYVFRILTFQNFKSANFEIAKIQKFEIAEVQKQQSCVHSNFNDKNLNDWI